MPPTTDHDAPTFGSLLRRHRLAAGLSQEALAERAGLSGQAISALESGARAAPHHDTVARLARALGLGPGERRALEGVIERRRGPAAGRASVLAVGLPPLPLPLTSFIGRERELAAAGALLRRPGVRLLTLTGPGGVGKTRLALRLAAEAAADFPDGTAFVSLADLAEPALVLPTVARAFGIQPGRREPAAVLAELLQHRRLLLLLDNCEQVAAAAPTLGALLAACPHLTILATSRSPLRLAAEQETSVPPLAVPPDDAPTPRALAAVEAVALFVARARAVRPDFALTDENPAAIAAICRRLDGLPLAIELAAARVRILSPAALLARLEPCLPLLADGAVDLPARQRTLRATLAWSDNLLAPGARRLFRRLAVFAGGAALTAIEAVGDPDRDLGIAALDGVAALVEQSLLRREDGADDEPRFRMLQTVRDYAAEELERCGEATATRRRHAAYYLALAEEAEPHLGGGARWGWLARLDAEQDNLRAALAWCAAAEGDPDWGLRLAGALPWFWYFRGHVPEGRDWLGAMLVRTAAAARSVARARALAGAGALAWAAGDYPAAASDLEEALAIAQERGEARIAASALTYLGVTTLLRGDPAGARARYEEGLACARAAGDEPTEAALLRYLGFAVALAGDRAAAAALYRESLARFRRLGDDWGAAFALQSLGGTAAAAGDAAAARRRYGEAVALLRGVGDRWLLAMALANSGAALARAGDQDGAQAACDEALLLGRAVGNRGGVGMALAGLAGVAAARGQAARSGRLFGAAVALAPSGAALLDGSDRAALERAAAAARARLDPAAFDAGWAEGRALTVDGAVAAALAMGDRPTAAPASA